MVIKRETLLPNEMVNLFIVAWDVQCVKSPGHLRKMRGSMYLAVTCFYVTLNANYLGVKATKGSTFSGVSYVTGGKVKPGKKANY